MEQLSLMVGIILMLVSALGAVLYVALVIAIPVWRALDWFADPGAARPVARPSPSRPTIWARLRKRCRLSH